VTISNVMGAPTVSVASGPKHAVHLTLTIFKCGLCLPIWPASALVNHGGVGPKPGLCGLVSARPVFTVSGNSVAVGAIMAAWK
jgi:hypothetical protein